MTTSNFKIFVVNPSMTARVKISKKYWYTWQGISTALESQTLSNLTCSKYIYRLKWVDRFWLVKALSGIVQGGQNDSKNQAKNAPCVHIWVNSQNRQLTGFYHDSYLPLKFSYSRRESLYFFIISIEWPQRLSTKVGLIVMFQNYPVNFLW